MKKFKNYRIPSNFFGLGAETVDYAYGSSSIIENLSDDSYVINTTGENVFLAPTPIKGINVW